MLSSVCQKIALFILHPDKKNFKLHPPNSHPNKTLPLKEGSVNFEENLFWSYFLKDISNNYEDNSINLRGYFIF